MAQEVQVIETENLKLYDGCFESNASILVPLFPDKVSK